MLRLKPLTEQEKRLLTPREAECVELYTDADAPMTQQKIAALLGVSQARVHALLHRAAKKLKHGGGRMLSLSSIHREEGVVAVA